jgi:TIR domain
MSVPKAFMSYSWDDAPHRAWVKSLSARLRGEGVNATLDHWEVEPGDQLPKFMETSVRENDFVVIVCTPNYKRKSDYRQGGVGYEGDIMTGEVFAGKDSRKFIPILRSGDWIDALPSWLVGKYGLDFRGDPYSEDQYHDLLTTLHGTREKAPPIGARPTTTTPRQAGGSSQHALPAEAVAQLNTEAIRVIGIIANEVGTPRNDGRRGSALYAVPFQLSRRPTSPWAEHFVQTWKSPPIYSTRHRPGIARIEGDRIILDGTTVDEVAEVHRDTLKLVVAKVNQDIEEWESRRRRAAEAEAARLRQHRQEVGDAAKRISFD